MVGCEVQNPTNLPIKEDGTTTLTSSEFNTLNTTVNLNAIDLQDRLYETDQRDIRLEDTQTSQVKRYSTPDLPNNKVDGTVSFDTSMEIPVYSQLGLWYRCSDDVSVSNLPEVDLFLTMGQSNADGKADINNLDPVLAALDRSDILAYLSGVDTSNNNTFIPGTWDPMVVGVNTANVSNRFGPEVGFADTVKQLPNDLDYTNPLALMKYAKGGTKLATVWDSDFADNFMYEGLLKALPDSKFKLGQAGYKFNIKGLIWYQGESDSSNQDDADNYQANLTALLTDIRTRLLTPLLPVVICKVSYEAGSEPTYLTEVRAAQQATADADPNIGIIDTLPYSKRDVVHLDAAGMYQLGVDIVPIMRNAINGTA